MTRFANDRCATAEGPRAREKKKKVRVLKRRSLRECGYMHRRSCRDAFKLVGETACKQRSKPGQGPHAAVAAAAAAARRQRATETSPIHSLLPEADFIISILSRFSFRISASLPTGVRYLDDLDKGGAPRRIRSGKVKSGRSTKDVARTENIDTMPPRRHAIRTPAFPRLKARRKTKSRLAD